MIKAVFGLGGEEIHALVSPEEIVDFIAKITILGAEWVLFAEPKEEDYINSYLAYMALTGRWN